MRGKFCLWVHTVFIISVIVANSSDDNLYVYGTYDLDRDGRSEILLFSPQSKSVQILRYVELDAEGNHRLVWAVQKSEIEDMVNNIIFEDVSNNGIQDLIVSVRPMEPETTSQSSLLSFIWTDSSFIKGSIKVSDKTINGDRLRVTHAVYSKMRDEIAITVSSPSRKVAIFEIENESNFILKKQLEPASFSSGYGKIYSGWFGPASSPSLAVFSREDTVLKVEVFEIDMSDDPIDSDLFGLHNNVELVASGITQLDVNKDGNMELLLPFQDGEVWTLSLTGGKLAFEKSSFSGLGLFHLNENATDQEINQLLLARVEAGLFESGSFLQGSEALLDSLDLALIDSVLVGDTVSIKATPGPEDGFYSFHWLRKPPQTAHYNPHNGRILWIPKDDEIGIHILSYGFEVRLKEQMSEEEDVFGERLQLVPVLEKRDSLYAFMVLDSTKPVAPPVIHYPFPENLYTVSTVTQYQDENRFLFEGTPSFRLTNDVLPGRTGLKHTITSNISTLPKTNKAGFIYQSHTGEEELQSSLSMTHDLQSNVLFVAIKPALDSLPQSFYPGDWDKELYAFPEFLFEGFTADLVMDSSSGSVVFYASGADRDANLPQTWFELSSPSRPDHVLRIYYDTGVVQKIHGEVKFNDSGSVKTYTQVDFSGDFEPVYMLSNLVYSEEDSIRGRVIPAIKLEDRTNQTDETQPNSKTADS